MEKLSVSQLIRANKTLNRSRTSSELLVRASALLYNKAEKITNGFFLSHGITAAQYNVLALLEEEDSRINQLTISKRMLVSPGNITRILDKLISAGLIEREEDPQDRRHKRVLITAKGRALHQKIKPIYHAFMRRLTGGLSEEIRRQVAYAMVEWAHQLDGFSYENL